MSRNLSGNEVQGIHGDSSQHRRVGMWIMEHDSKDETANPSIPPSKCKINTPDQHALSRNIPNKELNDLPMVLQHDPVYNWYREEETTGLVSIGKVTWMEESKIQRQLLMSWTSWMSKQPKENWTPADILEKYLCIRAKNSRTNLISLCDHAPRKASQKHGQGKQKTKQLGQDSSTCGGDRTQDP